MAMRMSEDCATTSTARHYECTGLVITLRGEQFRCSCRCHKASPDLELRQIESD